MAPKHFTIHTSTVFDSKAKTFRDNVSITVDPLSGSIADVYERDGSAADVKDGDIDLRGKVVMPGFVDAHTHIFLHSYESVSAWRRTHITDLTKRTPGPGANARREHR